MPPLIFSVLALTSRPISNLAVAIVSFALRFWRGRFPIGAHCEWNGDHVEGTVTPRFSIGTATRFGDLTE